MASKRNILNRKGIPLTVVKSAKQFKVKHIKAKTKNTVLDISHESYEKDETTMDFTFEETAADGSDLQQLSSHTKRKQKSAERWQSVQSVAFNAVIVGMKEPKLKCSSCKISVGVVKCYQCGPKMYYCESCATKIHHNSLFHHYMEIWQVCEFIIC